MRRERSKRESIGMADSRPEFPYADFEHGDVPEHRAAIDDFHAEYRSDQPDPQRLAAHAEKVRAVPTFLGPFEAWYLNPRVQSFLAELNTGVGI